MKTRSDAFYLQPERSCVPDSPVWYSIAPTSSRQLDMMLHRVMMVREVQEHILADASWARTSQTEHSRFFESEEKPLKESRSSRHIQMIAPNLIIPYAVMPRSSEDFFSMERLLIHCGKLPTVTVFNPIKYRLSYFTFFAEPKKNMVLESLFSFGIYPSCFFCKIGMGGSASICCHIS